MPAKSLYRIKFSVQDAVYEIYARSIYESDIFGFLEVDELVFGENSSLLVDPSEEKLKVEFKTVKKTLIPLHNIFRIDEVDKEGTAKIHERSGGGSNTVSLFPQRDKRND
ncbi:MAG: DUF1820 family protein [Legionellaceae bacterium]|nr:DUF1820 family protein [Legionellaceae bacterium]